MSKQVVLFTSNYTIYFEHIFYNKIYPVIVVHCDVVKWNKTIRNLLKTDSFNLFNKQIKPIIALHNKSDNKHMKFLTIMGFKPYMNEVTSKNGSKSMLFIWSKQ